MTNLQIIEALSTLAESQARTIRHFAMELEQARCLSEAEQKMVDDAELEYTTILGADEWPDKT